MGGTAYETESERLRIEGGEITRKVVSGVVVD